MTGFEYPAPTCTSVCTGEEIVHSRWKHRGQVNPLVVGSNPTGPITTQGVCSGDLADSLFRRHRGHLSTEGVFGALHSIGLLIEEAQIVVHKADEPDLLAHFADADLLTCEHVA